MLQTSPVSPVRKALGAVLVAGLALAGAGAVWAANPEPPTLISQPTWLSKPTGADIARLYPAAAAQAGLGGRATIDCGVADDGRLQNCVVLKELPAEAGFGQTALQLGQLFQMDKTSGDGRPTAGGKVMIPIVFVAPVQK